MTLWAGSSLKSSRPQAEPPILTMVDTYDAAGRKTKQVRNSATTAFAYDNADRLLSQQRPGGKSVTYTLDPFTNLKTIKAEGAQPVSMAINNQGFLVTMFDGPTRVTFTYDANRSSREAGWEHDSREQGRDPHNLHLRQRKQADREK